ncbi:MAG: phosphatase PAP2 family protein [Gemmatimonadaceae bacterium]
MRRWSSAARTATGAAVAVAHLAAAPADAQAQRLPRLEPRAARFWVGAAVALAATAALDRTLRDAALAHRSGTLDDLARVGNALGTGHDIVPALAVSYVAARLAHERRWADATLRIAAGYATANVVESALKGAAGRERPFVSGDPWRFHPFTTNGDYHSLPSAHVTHASAIAAGLAEYEGGKPWLAAAGYGAVGLVAWQRVYADQHWTSDATAGAVIGTASAKTVVRWLERRGERRAGAP